MIESFIFEVDAIILDCRYNKTYLHVLEERRKFLFFAVNLRILNSNMLSQIFNCSQKNVSKVMLNESHAEQGTITNHVYKENWRTIMVTGMLRIVLICLFSFYSLFLFSGCASQSSAPAPADVGPLPSSVSSFEDIALPSEMKLDQKKSMTIKTESFRGGVMQYSGKIEILSLRDFVIASMKNNQWKLVGEASYENIVLAFTKPNKTCLVTFEEGFGGSFGSTYLSLYITVDVTAGKKLNPFGEPISN